MKPVSTTAIQAWASKGFSTDLSVMVDSTGAGAFVDLTNWFDENWVSSLEINEDVDGQSNELTVTLFRKSAERDLSPFVTFSQLNRVGGVYVPALAPNRIIRVYGYVGAIDEGKDTMTAVPLFEGRIDQVNAGADGGEKIELRCRDGACDFQDEFIESSVIFGAPGGLNIVTVMQNIINTYMTQSVTTLTLWVPGTPPLFSINEYVQEKMSVMDALRRLADMIGWDVRWKYNPTAGQYQLAFLEPDRARASTFPVYTFTVNDKTTVSLCSVDRTDVRNRVRVVYTDAATQVPTSVFVTDPVSIAKYGPKYLELVEDASSEIDTSAEATVMANAILSDMAEPVTMYEMDTSFFPWIELNDDVFIQPPVGSDAVVDDLTDYVLTLAVTGITHKVDNSGRFSTTMSLRGKPSSGFTKWLRVETRAGVGAPWLDRTLGQPTGVLAVQTNGGFEVNYNAPTDPNWAYSIIYISTVNGFTPSNDNAVYKGRATRFRVPAVNPGITYYIKIIAYGKDGTQSLVSSQITTVAAWVGPVYEAPQGEARGELQKNSDFNIWTLPNDVTVRPPDNWLAVEEAALQAFFPNPNAAMWNQNATGWGVYAEQVGITGNWALRFRSKIGSTSTITAQQTAGIRSGDSIKSGSTEGYFPVTGDLLYELDCLYMTDDVSVNGNPTMRVQWFTSAFVAIGLGAGVSLGNFGNNNWGRRRWRTRAPSNARYARLLWYPNPTHSAGTLNSVYSIWLDYFKMRRADVGGERNSYNSGLSGQLTNVLKPLTFSAEAYDFGGDFFAGTAAQGDYFTAPEDGFYDVSGQFGYTATAAGNAVIYIQTSPNLTTWTTVREGARRNVANTEFSAHNVTARIPVAKGTSIRLAAGKTDANAANIATSAVNSFFSVRRVDELL